MKRTKLLSLTSTILIGFGGTAWAGPHGVGGGFSGSAHFGGYSGAIRAAPIFAGAGVRFNGNRSLNGVSGTPQQFSYYNGAPGARTTGLTQHTVVRQQPNRSTTASVGSRANIIPEQIHAGSVARQNTRVGKVGNSQMAAAAVRRAIANHNVLARHDANWHRDWDKRRAHFHQGHVFVFTDGFWWGLSPAYFPWDYYPYYAGGDYPYGYDDYPYDYYDYSSDNHDGQSAHVDSDQDGNNSTLSAVQSALAKLGYYSGSIDGVEGDGTQAALARYQQDHDLSVTGTLTAATLRSLGLMRTAG